MEEKQEPCPVCLRLFMFGFETLLQTRVFEIDGVNTTELYYKALRGIGDKTKTILDSDRLMSLEIRRHQEHMLQISQDLAAVVAKTVSVIDLMATVSRWFFDNGPEPVRDQRNTTLMHRIDVAAAKLKLAQD